MYEPAPRPIAPPPAPPPRDFGPPHALLVLSVLLLFVGCYLVNAAAHEIKDELGPVLGLLGLFNLYELSVLTAAAWLARHGGRTAVRLLCAAAALLMVDLTFNYNELAVAHLGLGAAAAAFAAGTGLVKAGVVARLAGFRLTRGEWLAVAAGLVGVFGGPLLLRAVSGTTGRWCR